MNYLLYRRLTGPVFLLTFGVNALLNEWHVLSFERSWPLYLIAYGVLKLLEGAAFAASAQVASTPAATYPTYPSPVPPVPGTSLATIAPAPIQPAGSTGEES